MHFCHVFLATFFTVTTVWCANGSDSQRMRLKIIKHQPCTSGSTNEAIRFPTNAEAPLRADKQKGDGCYSIKGKVNVTKEINGVVQLYTVMQYGTNADPEQCHGQDGNNCGGVGSCVYCDACKNLKELGKSAVQLLVSGKPMDCKKGLKPQVYSDIQVSFCTPTKKEFLDQQNMDADFFDKYVKNRLFFMTIYLYNKEVNALSQDNLTKIATPTNKDVIGCHKLVGRISDTDDS